MHAVEIEYECGCFKKSEYSAKKEFDTQQDAYNYANILVEFMAEDFCTKHHFFVQKIDNDDFVIRVVDNPNAGSSCGTGSSSGSCGTSCGC